MPGLGRESAEEHALVELSQWLARVVQYSASHPACAPLANRTHQAFTRALAVRAPLVYGVLTDGITVGDEPSTHPALRTRMAPLLHALGLVAVRVLPGVTIDELHHFIELLTMPPEVAFEQGGLSRLAAERGVVRIQLEELSHEVTAEGREAAQRRSRLREYFREMLRRLIADRELDFDLGEHLAELLRFPDIAVTILEEDGAGIAEAVAGLALMARQEEARSGVKLAERVRNVVVALSPKSKARVLLGFPPLLGEFRASLAWVFDALSEEDVARFAFAAIRTNVTDIDTVLYALTAAVPDEMKRRGGLRWTSLAFADLPVGVAAGADAVLAEVARPVGEYESFRAEREILRVHAARALLLHPFVAEAQRAPSIPPMMRIASVPSMPAVREASLTPPPSMRAVLTSSAPPPTFGDAAGSMSIPPLPGAPEIHRGPPTWNGRRAIVEVMQIAARVGGLPRVCRTLPGAAAALAEEGAVDAICGVVRGLSDVAPNDRAGVAQKALGDIGASRAAPKMLAAIDAAIGAAEGEELEDMVALTKLVVLGAPEVALHRLELSENRKMRRVLLDAIPLSVTARPLVRARLNSSSWFVVRNAVLLLARCGGTPRDLAPVADHPNEKVRIEVARALRTMPPDEAAMDIAAQLLNDPAQEVALAARSLLRGELLGAKAIAQLTAIAEDEQQADDLRRRIIDTLGRSPRDEAASALYKLLQPRGLLELGISTELRDLAAAALQRSPAPSAKALFEEGLASTNRRVRKSCERARGGGA